MKKDVQVLKDVNSLMIITFLNADLEMNGEADSRDQELQNNKDYFNRQSQGWLCFFMSIYYDFSYQLGFTAINRRF
jgi:hypothetical protein